MAKAMAANPGAVLGPDGEEDEAEAWSQQKFCSSFE